MKPCPKHAELRNQTIGSLWHRRRLLSAGVMGGATWAWTWQLAAARDVAPLEFLVVSDTHVGRKDNRAAEENWRRAVVELNEQPGQFVLHLGDIVDGGRASQYPVYAGIRAMLNKPIHEIPGNHDPVKLFRQHVHAETDRSVVYGELRFVLFNNSRRESHDGFITHEQIDWLENEFAIAARLDQRVVVACHVPIHANKHPDRGWYVKPDQGQRAFYRLQAGYADRLLVCLHGHFHNGIRGWRDHGRTVEVLCPSVCYNQDRNLSQHLAAGRATGFFVDELRPGLVLVRLGNGRLTMRYKPLHDQSPARYEAAF